jgi:23S rRNA pseudoU1915 N3-methylase RlmH
VHLKGNPKKASAPEAQQKFEAEQLLGALDGRDYVAVLDERGSQVTSFDIAETLATAGALAAPSSL